MTKDTRFALLTVLLGSLDLDATHVACTVPAITVAMHWASCAARDLVIVSFCVFNEAGSKGHRASKLFAS